MQDCYTKTSSQILAHFKTSPFGLTCNEAKNRLEKQGLNQLENTKKQNLLVKFLKQFCDTMVIILLCASVISLIFALVKQSKTELVDSIIIFIIVLINAILGFSQELKAENALESLKKMSQPYSLVLRKNSPTKIKTSELVVGDVVLLEAGDIVPADIYLLEALHLNATNQISQAKVYLLTSVPTLFCQKQPISEIEKICVFLLQLLNMEKAKELSLRQAKMLR